MGKEQSENGQPTEGDEASEDASAESQAPEGSASSSEASGEETGTSETSGTSGTEAAGGNAPPDDPSSGAPPEDGKGTGSGRVLTAVAAVLALVVGLVIGWAVGSAGADDEDEAADGDHHGAEDEDDLGLAELLADHHYHPPSGDPLGSEDRQLLTYQLTVLNRLIDEYPTVGDAEDGDWRRAGPFIPGLGTHYIPKDTDYTFTIPSSVGDDEEGEEVRPLLIYEGLEEDSPLTGFMLMAVGDQDPVGFAGEYDDWHRHTNVCVVVQDDLIDLPFVGDMDSVTDDMCEAVGGNMTEITADMVHVWSVPGYESELGLFSEVNPKIMCRDGTYHRVPYDELVPPYETVCPGD